MHMCTTVILGTGLLLLILVMGTYCSDKGCNAENMIPTHATSSCTLPLTKEALIYSSNLCTAIHVEL